MEVCIFWLSSPSSPTSHTLPLVATNLISFSMFFFPFLDSTYTWDHTSMCLPLSKAPDTWRTKDSRWSGHQGRPGSSFSTWPATSPGQASEKVPLGWGLVANSLSCLVLPLPLMRTCPGPASRAPRSPSDTGQKGSWPAAPPGASGVLCPSRWTRAWPHAQPPAVCPHWPTLYTEFLGEALFEKTCNCLKIKKKLNTVIATEHCLRRVSRALWPPKWPLAPGPGREGSAPCPQWCLVTLPDPLVTQAHPSSRTEASSICSPPSPYLFGWVYPFLKDPKDLFT